MTSGRVSAVLTTYNRAELAKQAFRSIAEQTLAPAEIIVVEDASETDVSAWIASLGRDDTTYVRHERNRGLAAARNTGLRLSKCELIAYLDDDDEWLPTRLEEQVRRFESLPNERKRRLAAIQVGAKILDRAGQQRGIRLPENQGNLRDSIIERGAVTPSSSFMFVKRALEEVGGFDETLMSGIDHDIWMTLAVAGYANEIIEKPLVVLYQDGRQTMMSTTEERVAGLSRFVDKWTPTYLEWFGTKSGRVYAKRYFISVVSKLAGQKLADGKGGEARTAASSSARMAGWSLELQAYSFFCSLRSYLAHAFPRLRRTKRSLLRQRPD